jgi:hypothetical protein
MNNFRKTAIVVGILFLVCTVASIVGGSLSNPLLEGADYLAGLAGSSNRVFAGALIEFIWAATGAGIAIALYPVLRKQNGALALGAAASRTVEGIFVLVGTLSLLSVFTLSREFVGAGAAAAASYQASGSVLLALRDWAHGSIGLVAFSLGTVLYSAALYQSRLIPRWLSAWGFCAAVLCLGVTLYSTFNADFGLTALNTLLNAPIGLQEMVLAVWLIAKGFNPSTVSSLSAKRTANALLSAA